MKLFTRKEVIARLRKVASGDFSDVANRAFGLCQHTLDMSVDAASEWELDIDVEDTFYARLFAKWPEFSGSVVFPVGNGYEDWVKQDPSIDNGWGRDHWVSSYGRSRLRLAAFLADELEKL